MSIVLDKNFPKVFYLDVKLLNCMLLHLIDNIFNFFESSDLESRKPTVKVYMIYRSFHHPEFSRNNQPAAQRNNDSDSWSEYGDSFKVLTKGDYIGYM